MKIPRWLKRAEVTAITTLNDSEALVTLWVNPWHPVNWLSKLKYAFLFRIWYRIFPDKNPQKNYVTTTLEVDDHAES